jgi:stage IV sporulation protein FB
VTVGRILGIPVRVHWVLLLIVAGYLATGHGMEIVLGLLSLLAHELAHAVAGEALDVRVARVELWPFGGRSELEGLDSREPAVQALVALAGPLSSGFLALAGWGVGRLVGTNPALLTFFMEMNGGLAVFNLIPAAPLDGGRIWQALRQSRVGYAQAEREVRAAAWSLAAVLGALALLAAAFGHVVWPLWVMAGFLVWAARQPLYGRLWPVRDLATRAAAWGMRPVWPLADLAVREDARLAGVLDAMRPRQLHRVAVLGPNQEVRGILWERDLLRALKETGPDTPVGRLIRRPN